MSLSATSENPSGVASALCYGSQGFPGSLGSLHLPAPQPCGGRSSGSSASTDLTAPLLLSHGINSWNQLPTAAGYMLKCKPHDWAENVAWVSPGAPLRNWELAGSGEASLGGQAFSTSLHLSPPPPRPSSSFAPGAAAGHRLSGMRRSYWGNLEAETAAVQRLQRGRNIMKYKQQNPSPRGLDCSPSTFSMEIIVTTLIAISLLCNKHSLCARQ